MNRGAAVACAGIAAVYAALGIVSHLSLRTNAFDLSVFDYAMWTSASGGPIGYVPMFGYSLFAQHFMPTLLILAPLSGVFDSPVYLIVLQALFHGTAGYLLFRFAGRHASRPIAWALLAAFFLSRRSHSAVTSYFYIESAEPMLIFGALLAWSAGRRSWFWVCTLLALGCKEDVAIYFLGFGVLLYVTRRDRSLGLATSAASAIWLAASLVVVIPLFRHVYHLGGVNPFIEGRYGAEAASVTGGALVGRLLSLQSLGKLVTLTSATGFVCLLSPAWAAVALPGIAINLAANPDTVQAGLVGHYLWPILPWLFAAAVFGAARVPPTARRWLPLAIVAIVLIDAPLPRTLLGTPWRDLPAAAAVRSNLAKLQLSGVVVAQPNLIPHLPRRRDVRSLGVYAAGQPRGDYVLLTTVGDLWPFDEAGVREEIARLHADPGYERIMEGPLAVFRKR